MFECIKSLLESSSSGPHNIECNTSPPDAQLTKEALHNYLEEKLGVGNRCLFHLDEHRHMCPRIYEDGTGKDFSRGAMQILAETEGAVAIATYIDLPNLPSQGSSGVCRDPVFMPILDVVQVMEVVPELRWNYVLNIPEGKTSRNTLRKLANLKLRLGLKIQMLGIPSFVHRRKSSERTEVFLSSFEAASKGANKEVALESCIQLCGLATDTTLVEDINIASLLVGVPDKEYLMKRQLSDLITVQGELLTGNFRRLLSKEDPNVEVFNEGRALFASMLGQVDYLASTPLEAAFSWVLSTRSALRGGLNFLETGTRFSIKCTSLESARLFPGDDSSICVTEFLRQDVFYCADERNGKATHPLADIFFITKKKELVLVDITGGDSSTVLKKRKNLLSWIGTMGGCINGQYTLHGVVLAPLDESCTSTSAAVPGTSESKVEVVRGVEAQNLLGGLRQIYEWLQ